MLCVAPREKKLVLHVADLSIKTKFVLPSASRTFERIDGNELQFPPERPPYLRMLAYHASASLEMFGALTKPGVTEKYCEESQEFDPDLALTPMDLFVASHMSDRIDTSW